MVHIFQGVSWGIVPQIQIQISNILGNKLSIKERVFCSRRFGFKSNFDLLATQLTPTNNEQMIIIKLHTFLLDKILFLSMALFKLLLLL